MASGSKRGGVKLQGQRPVSGATPRSDDTPADGPDITEGRKTSIAIPILTFVVGVLGASALDVRQYVDGRKDRIEDERREISALLGERLNEARELAPKLDCYRTLDTRATELERRVAAQLRNYVARSGQIRNAPLHVSEQELRDKRMDVGIISTWIDSAEILQRDLAARLPADRLSRARSVCDG